MKATNRELASMREAIEYEIFRLNHLRRVPRRRVDKELIDRQVASLSHQRAALRAVMVNRRVEAAKDIVIFARWVSGNGALDHVAAAPADRRVAQTI